MPLERIPRAEALSKPDFHRRLRLWLKQTEDQQVGSSGVPGVTPWVYIKEGTQLFELHADTKRDAVSHYLGLVAALGEDIQWKRGRSQRGKETAVVYGPSELRHTPFYLYASKGS